MRGAQAVAMVRKPSMYVLTLECREAEAEIVSAELWDCGATGILEESATAERCRLRAWFAGADGLIEKFAAFSPMLAEEADRDWEAESRQAWQPFCVGRTLYLAPEWDESPAPKGRYRLTVHPGLALGTGAHAATQLALMALEDHMRMGESVLDVGTGSGILAEAAMLLGAGKAVGCDIDGDAVAIARRNLTTDGVSPRVFTGSLRSVKDAAVDLLVANINAETHAMLAAEYARVARRAVIVSGYELRDEERVVRAMTAQGLRAAGRAEADGWVCLLFCLG
jgi:ribosomal protein L11 methyltransferase